MYRVAYVAIDLGAKAAVAPLAQAIPGVWPAAVSASSLRTAGTEMLVCGTSDSTGGRETECYARLVAARLGIACVVIEDFPGNFVHVAEAPPRLLCVESNFAADLARRKADDAELPVHVGPAIRYDALRRRLPELRKGAEESRAVLWIGQPETVESLETLRLILPVLRAGNVRIWLRAHPRDVGYASGAYCDWFDGGQGDVEDVTFRSLDDCFRRRPRLVLTQFSSVAVEAGFWGIPSLNVLLPQGGGKRLAEMKGYAVPPWCIAGAAFYATDVERFEETLHAAVEDDRARKMALEHFDRYFMVEEEGVPGLVNVLYNQGFLQSTVQGRDRGANERSQ